jgi:hypothetical protein
MKGLKFKMPTKDKSKKKRLDLSKMFLKKTNSNEPKTNESKIKESKAKGFKIKEPKIIKQFGEISIIQNIKIRKVLNVSFFAILLLPLLIVVLFFSSSSEKTVQEKVGLVTAEMSNQATNVFNFKINEIENISTQLFTNTALIEAISPVQGETDYEKTMRIQNGTNLLSGQVLASGNFIESMYIITDERIFEAGKSSDSNASTAFIKGDFKSSQLYKDLNANKGIRWVTGLNGDYSKIYLMRNLSNIKSGKNIGIMVFAMRNGKRY